MEGLHDIHDLVKLEDYDELKEVAQNLGVMNVPQREDNSEAASDNEYLNRLQS